MNPILTSIFITLTCTLFGCDAIDQISQNSLQQKENSVCYETHCFEVTYAMNSADRSRGLMEVEYMDQDKGMLFVFENEGLYPFWMKNTLIPLDIIWIDANKKVVFIGENVQPCEADPCPNTYPSGNALYVLELNAGVSNQISLKIGDQLTFETPEK